MPFKGIVLYFTASNLSIVRNIKFYDNNQKANKYFCDIGYHNTTVQHGVQRSIDCTVKKKYLKLVVKLVIFSAIWS